MNITSLCLLCDIVFWSAWPRDLKPWMFQGLHTGEPFSWVHLQTPADQIFGWFRHWGPDVAIHTSVPNAKRMTKPKEGQGRPLAIFYGQLASEELSSFPESTCCNPVAVLAPLHFLQDFNVLQYLRCRGCNCKVVPLRWEAIWGDTGYWPIMRWHPLIALNQ